VIGLGAVCLGATSRYLGRLALALGQRQQAVEHLREAVRANARLGATAELAHAQLDLAKALGGGSEAAQLIEQARATAGERDLVTVARRAAKLRGG
jgi:tetratricopeptide (TPR) repeat protein